MTEEELIALFEKDDAEYMAFKRIKDPLHPRPDLCAFLLLDKLVPKRGCDMVAGAEHDEIYLEPSLESLVAAGITEEDVLTLRRCGVRLDDHHEGLAMFA